MDTKLEDLLKTYQVYITQLKTMYKNDFYVNVLESNDGFKIISTNMKIFNKNYKPVVNLNKYNEIESYNCNCEESNDNIICDHILLLLDKYYRLISSGTPKEDKPIKVVGNITYHDYYASKDGKRIRNKRIFEEE